MSKQTIKFPAKFLWGASTSAHQVEGGTHNQWTEWELENAKSLAAQAPYQFSDLDNWDQISQYASSPDNYVSGLAVDHFNRFEEDFELAKSLGHNSFRFSIEWSRIEPSEGAWDPAAIEHYKKYLAALEKHSLTPVMTLFHFTLPTWFAQKGGFTKSSNVKYFVRFAQKVIQELGGQVRYIITINEPMVYVQNSYLNGTWPPAMQNRRIGLQVLENLIRAHNQTARMIRKESRKYQVSVANNISHVYAGDDAKLTEASAHMAGYLANRYVLRRTIKTSTFIGLNYYFSDRYYGYRRHNPDQQLSDVGWDMQPSDIQLVLEDIHSRFKKPILITENGLADADDKHRKWWLSQTVMAIYKAMKNDVPVIGYLHWSLLDNFEWEKGFWPKFGLVAVEPGSLKRRIRPSATWYRDIITKVRSK